MPLKPHILEDRVNGGGDGVKMESTPLVTIAECDRIIKLELRTPLGKDTRLVFNAMRALGTW